jgi:enolase
MLCGNKIAQVKAREILDSRGNPTVEATVVLEDGSCGVAAAPSGASTGKYEAHELRDGEENRYGGKGVLKALENINGKIARSLIRTMCNQGMVDCIMIREDDTPNKSRLGANATLAVSLAAAKAGAMHAKLPLYRYVGGVGAQRIPTPMMNILNGGAHASNNIEIQEFMIVPVGAESFSEALRMGSEIFHMLGKILKRNGYASTVGDEGGYAPDLESDEEALALIMEAIGAAGLDGERVKLALDAAAGEWQSEEGYLLPKRQRRLSRDELIAEWERLSEKYPIISIEDGVAEDDFQGFKALTARLGDRMMLVGDDLFVTNPKRLARGIREGAGNAILIKPNQIGTLTETLRVIAMARAAGYAFILSHRSGETEDTTIADIAVATGARFIKSGAPCRTDRVAKYNRLLRIESALAPHVAFGK